MVAGVVVVWVLLLTMPSGEVVTFPGDFATEGGCESMAELLFTTRPFECRQRERSTPTVPA